MTCHINPLTILAPELASAPLSLKLQAISESLKAEPGPTVFELVFLADCLGHMARDAKRIERKVATIDDIGEELRRIGGV